LLPALCVLVVGEAILARYVFDPVSASQLRGDGIATLLYFQNWRLALGGSTVLPHTWSLSVEEQWYFIWPLLLSLLLVFARGRTRVLFSFVAVGAVASAVECAWLFRARTAAVAVSNRSYYGTDTRAQELLVGAALAVVLLSWGPSRSRLLQIGGWLSIAFLGWCFVAARSGDAWIYRGGFMLIAIAAALLIAAVVQSPNALLGRALAARPLVAIGLVSYGLYLYHMPIDRWLTSDSTHLRGIALLVVRLGVTASVAVASYFLVERPFRRGASLDRKRVIVLSIAGVLALTAIVAATPAAIRPPANLAIYALSVARHDTPKGVRRVLVVGDTSAFDLKVRSNGVFDNSSIRGAAYGLNGCDLFAGHRTATNGTPASSPASCSRILAKLAQATAAYSPAEVMLMIGASEARDRVTNTGTIHYGSPEFQALVVAAIDHAKQRLTAAGAAFVLLPVQCEPAAEIAAPKLRWLNLVLAQYARDHPTTRYLPSNDANDCTTSTWAQIAAASTPRH
jgi:peptidoglycan/LPS O-acetylase OafA/YrhL